MRSHVLAVHAPGRALTRASRSRASAPRTAPDGTGPRFPGAPTSRLSRSGKRSRPAMPSVRKNAPGWETAATSSWKPTFGSASRSLRDDPQRCMTGGTCCVVGAASRSSTGTRSATAPGSRPDSHPPSTPGSGSRKISGTHSSPPTDATSGPGTDTRFCATSGPCPRPARSCAMATSTPPPSASFGSGSSPSALATTRSGHRFDGTARSHVPLGPRAHLNVSECDLRSMTR
jgi:hypothetical protein